MLSSLYIYTQEFGIKEDWEMLHSFYLLMGNLIILFPSWITPQFLSCLVLSSFWGAGLRVLVIVWSCLKLSTENICLKQIHCPVCILFPLLINWFYECLWDLSLSNWFWLNLEFVLFTVFYELQVAFSFRYLLLDFIGIYGIWVWVIGFD